MSEYMPETLPDRMSVIKCNKQIYHIYIYIYDYICIHVHMYIYIYMPYVLPDGMSETMSEYMNMYIFL